VKSYGFVRGSQTLAAYFWKQRSLLSFLLAGSGLGIREIPIPDSEIHGLFYAGI
jgi:hypothetical protein